jgi:neutral trehalase
MFKRLTKGQCLAEAARYRTRASDLKRALEFLWDEAAANYQYRARSSVQPDQRWVKIVDVGTLLPLWAGMVDAPRARRIIKTHLLNPKEMWREHGIPSLSAAEPEYTAVPTSSNWNGQLWIQWNTLFVDALLQYGFTNEADALARRTAKMQTTILKMRRHFFEDYSADNLTHTNAIYDYNWGGGNIQSFLDIAAARKNRGKFSIYQ